MYNEIEVEWMKGSKKEVGTDKNVVFVISPASILSFYENTNVGIGKKLMSLTSWWVQQKVPTLCVILSAEPYLCTFQQQYMLY